METTTAKITMKVVGMTIGRASAATVGALDAAVVVEEVLGDVGVSGRVSQGKKWQLGLGPMLEDWVEGIMVE